MKKKYFAYFVTVQKFGTNMADSRLLKTLYVCFSEKHRLHGL